MFEGQGLVPLRHGTRNLIASMRRTLYIMHHLLTFCKLIVTHPFNPTNNRLSDLTAPPSVSLPALFKTRVAIEEFAPVKHGEWAVRYKTRSATFTDAPPDVDLRSSQVKDSAFAVVTVSWNLARSRVRS